MNKLLALSAMTLAMSQAHAIEHKIIGGTQASADSYPWMVSLQSKEGEHFCGGSLLDAQWVLTAAHCVEQEVAANIQAVVSEYHLKQTDNGEETLAVEAIYIPDNYGDDHDIAVLKLKTASQKSTVAAANTALTDSLATGTDLTVMGWGNTSTSGESFPDILQQVEVPLFAQADCKTNYGNIGVEITGNMICAGLAAGGKDSCQGDSGGPLVINNGGTWTQIGVVSFGEACAQANFPGVYTRLANYQDWIAKAKAGEVAPYVAQKPRPGHQDMTVLGLPMYLDFFTEESGVEDVRTLTIENPASATASLQISTMTIDNPAFSLSDNNCADQVLSAGQSCTFKATYTSVAGEAFHEGLLSVVTNHADYNPLEVELFAVNEAELDEDFDGGCSVYAAVNVPQRKRPGNRPELPEGFENMDDFEFEGEFNCDDETGPDGENNNQGGDEDDDTTTITVAGAWNPISLLLGFMLLPLFRRRK